MQLDGTLYRWVVIPNGRNPTPRDAAESGTTFRFQSEERLQEIVAASSGKIPKEAMRIALVSLNASECSVEVTSAFDELQRDTLKREVANNNPF